MTCEAITNSLKAAGTIGLSGLTHLANGVKHATLFSGSQACYGVATLANVAKQSTLYLGSLATIAIGVDSFAYNWWGMYNMPAIYSSNNCNKPVPTLVNVCQLYDNLDQKYCETTAVEFFKKQQFAFFVAPGALYLGYYAFKKLETNATQVAASLDPWPKVPPVRR